MLSSQLGRRMVCTFVFVSMLGWGAASLCVAGPNLEKLCVWLHGLGVEYARDLVCAGDVRKWPGAEGLPSEDLLSLQSTIEVCHVVCCASAWHGFSRAAPHSTIQERRPGRLTACRAGHIFPQRLQYVWPWLAFVCRVRKWLAPCS